MQLLGLLAVPLVVASLAWLIARETISRGEFFAQILISAALVSAAWSWGRAQTLEDVEHLNGFISAKSEGHHDCCHCHTECRERNIIGRCKREVERCSHPHDFYWRVEVEGAGQLEQTCMTRQKLPAWWAQVREGKPGVIEHRYQNYLRADPDSLMHQGFNGEHPSATAREVAIERHAIPELPRVHDGLFVDRVVELGVEAPANWEWLLRELNATLGARKQVDVTLVIGDSESPDLALAVDAAWMSGPKNGAIIVLGAPDGASIAWARLVSVSSNPSLEIALRERLRGRALQDPQIIPIIAEELDSKFERTPMSTFEYLAGSAAPRGWILVGLYALALLLSLALSYLFHRVDFSREGLRRATGKHARKGMWMALGAGLVALVRRRRRRY